MSKQVPIEIPRCSACGASRAFEMQVMSTLIDLHPNKMVAEGCDKMPEFGSIVVYTCISSCGDEGNFEEYAFVESSV